MEFIGVPRGRGGGRGGWYTGRGGEGVPRGPDPGTPGTIVPPSGPVSLPFLPVPQYRAVGELPPSLMDTAPRGGGEYRKEGMVLGVL